MATWLDFFSLIFTFSIFAGVIYGGLYLYKQFKDAVANTKENLKSKGLHISKEGVSVKTQKHFDREDYVDATQRGVMKVLSASSFTHQNPTSSTSIDPTSSSSPPSTHAPLPMSASTSAHTLSPPSIERTKSNASSVSSQEKRRRAGLFSGGWRRSRVASDASK